MTEFRRFESVTGVEFWLREAWPGLLFQCNLVPTGLCVESIQEPERPPDYPPEKWEIFLKHWRRKKYGEQKETPDRRFGLQRLACLMIAGRTGHSGEFEPVQFAVNPSPGQEDVKLLPDSDLMGIYQEFAPDVSGWVDFVNGSDQGFVVQAALVFKLNPLELIFGDPLKSAIVIGLAQKHLKAEIERAEKAAKK